MTIRSLNSEKSLITSCKKGDRKAQKRLYETYAGKMLYVAQRYMGDEFEAQEVLLAAFLKVFQQLDRFEFKGSFEGWIRRIVVRSAIDALRKRRMDVSIDSIQISEMEEEETNQTLYSEDQIIQAMDQLSENYRTVFNLYVLEGYKHQEISDLLGISLSASKTQLLRARKQLRTILTKSKSHEKSILG